MRRRGYCCSLCLLSGCGLLEVGPASEITGIEPVSIRVEVIELGPLNPDRVAFPSDSPIAEAMPGDRVRLTIEVVDVDGLALADSRLDSYWWMGGLTAYVFDSAMPLEDLELRCTALESWTTSSVCELGDGRGSIEFEIPPLDEMAEFVSAYVPVSVAIAWDGESARACWDARAQGKAMPSDCDFVNFGMFLGPRWWLMRYGAAQGIPTFFPLDRVPAPVFLEQANRPPQVEALLIEREDEVLRLAPSDGVVGPIPVAPGERLRLSYEVDENLQFAQAKFVPLNEEADLFTLVPERLGARVATAGPIRVDQQNPIPSATPIMVTVNDDALPGLARVVLAVHDYYAEQVIRVELDVQ